MALLPFNSNPSRRELRQFAGIWLPLFCAVVAMLLWKAGMPGARAGLIAAVGVGVGLLGWLRPQLFRPIFVGWMIAAYPIGWVISHLVLAILYFGVLTPMGWALRLLGRDPMARRWDLEASTYWTPHREPNDDAGYFRQF